MNFIFGFSVANRHDGSSQEAGRIKTLLAVIMACILNRTGRTVEDPLGIGEIKAMLFQVRSPLNRVPCEVHGIMI